MFTTMTKRQSLIVRSDVQHLVSGKLIRMLMNPSIHTLDRLTVQLSYIVFISSLKWLYLFFLVIYQLNYGRTGHGGNCMTPHHSSWICLGTATLTYQTASSLDEAHAFSLSPDWSQWTQRSKFIRAQRWGEVCSLCDGLTFQRPFSSFFFLALCLVLFGVSQKEEEQNIKDTETELRVKKPAGKGREKGGFFCLSAGCVFVKVFRLVRDRLRWGRVCLPGCSVRVLS